MYTVMQKTYRSSLMHNFWQMLTDFPIFFTDGLSSKLATSLFVYFSVP